MRPSPLWLVALASLSLTACWVSGNEVQNKIDEFNEDGSDTGPTGTVVEPLVITQVTPDFGSTDGGGEVEIYVEDANSDETIVLFGNREATVIDTTPAKVVVEVPQKSGGGPVDIVVQTEDAEGSLEDGYRYFTDATGRTAAIGVLRWREPQGDYWTDNSPLGDGFFLFTNPTSTTFEDLYAPGLDTCVLDYSGGSIQSVSTGASQATLETPSGTQIPFSTSGNQFINYGLESHLSSYSNQRLELLTMSGDEDWPDHAMSIFTRRASPAWLEKPLC